MRDMQAGDTLDFIRPFTGIEQREDECDKISEADLYVMMQLLNRFINDRAENVHSFAVLEPFGLVTVFEGSYRLDMPDDSYLHVAVYGTQNDDGIIEFGVSVNEHLADGMYNGGHSYLYDFNGLSRSTSAPDLSEELDEEDREMLRRHYMLSDHYAEREILAEAKRSDDFEVREHAEAAQKRIDEELAFDEIAESMGVDNQRPYPGELEQLRTLIWDARPFPLHNELA